MWTMIASFLVILLVAVVLLFLLGTLGTLGFLLEGVLLATGIAAWVYTVHVRLKRVEDKLDQLLARMDSPDTKEEKVEDNHESEI